MSLFEFLLYAALFIIEFIAVFALIDVIRRPAWQWEQARKSKVKWIVLLVIGLFLPGGGILLALIYFFITQNALKVATPPIGRPGDWPR